MYVACIALLVASVMTEAGVVRKDGVTINKTTVVADRDSLGEVAYGGCLINITPKLVGCSTYMAIDCKGRAGRYTASEGRTLFDAANLAKVSGRTVLVQADNAVKINGYCVVDRIRID